MTAEFEDKSSDPGAQQARHWVVRLASGEMTEAERTRLRQWLNADVRNRAAFKRERAFWQSLEPLREAFQYEDTAPAHHSAGPPRILKSRPAVGAGRPLNGSSVMMRSARRMNRIAAAGLIAAGLAFLMVWTQFGGFRAGDHWTRVGEHREVILPDGSTAHLNTASAINVRYSDDVRRIELLQGEAFFDVKPDPDAPFQVAMQNKIVEAVGTSFAVHREGEGFTVTVNTGEVAVHDSPGENPAHSRTESSQSVHLKAGEQIDYSPDSVMNPIRSVKLDSALAWRRGKIVIADLPFMQAIEKLDRYHPGRIVVLGKVPGQRTVSGVFNTDRIDGAITGLASTQGLAVSHLTDYLVVLR